MTLLSPAQASEIVGVPAVQLCRWAYLGQGPRNSGTKHKPMFDEDDLMKWRSKLITSRAFSYGEVNSTEVLAGNAFFQMIKRA